MSVKEPRTRIYAAAACCSLSVAHAQPTIKQQPQREWNLQAGQQRPRAAAIAALLHSSSAPYAVLHNYWNASMVRAARAEVIDAVHECADVGEGSDYRRLGVENVSSSSSSSSSSGSGSGSGYRLAYPLGATFAADDYLHEVAWHFTVMAMRRSKSLARQGPGFNTKAQAGYTRAGQASGGGWHKDTHRQGIKALLYLDETAEANGPFQMLLGYSRDRLKHNRDPKQRTTRFDEADVEKEVQHGASVRSFFAPAGTVIFFEISNVHRGAPCRQGERASLTNYYKVAKASTACAKGQTVALDLKPGAPSST